MPRDLQRRLLLEAVQALGEPFDAPTDRKPFLSRALGPSHPVISDLYYGGSSRNFATTLVTRLDRGDLAKLLRHHGGEQGGAGLRKLEALADEVLRAPPPLVPSPQGRWGWAASGAVLLSVAGASLWRAGPAERVVHPDREASASSASLDAAALAPAPSPPSVNSVPRSRPIEPAKPPSKRRGTPTPAKLATRPVEEGSGEPGPTSEPPGNIPADPRHQGVKGGFNPATVGPKP